jgi:hypothetical protein
VGILPHVLESRALISGLLFAVLVAGGAPWRVASHEHEGHGRVWLPDIEHLLHAHGHAHGSPTGATARADACSHCSCCEHDPCCPGAPSHCPDESEEGHCHCDDQALVTGVPFALVALDAPAVAFALVEVADVSRGLGAPEVAPSEPDRRRVACEEDSIVLLR